jgi:hypothetical protein
MANKEKAEVKIHVANEIGVELETLYEQALKAEQQHEGAGAALTDASSRVATLVGHLKKAVDSGELKLDELKTPDAVVKVATQYIGLACLLLDKMAQDAKVSRITTAGMASGFKRAMDVPKKLMDAEQQKLVALQAAEATTPVESAPARVVGQHPGNPLAARRAEANGQKPPPLEKAGKGKKGRAANA